MQSVVHIIVMGILCRMLVIELNSFQLNTRVWFESSQIAIAVGTLASVFDAALKSSLARFSCLQSVVVPSANSANSASLPIPPGFSESIKAADDCSFLCSVMALENVLKK